MSFITPPQTDPYLPFPESIIKAFNELDEEELFMELHAGISAQLSLINSLDSAKEIITRMASYSEPQRLQALLWFVGRTEIKERHKTIEEAIKRAIGNCKKVDKVTRILFEHSILHIQAQEKVAGTRH